MSKKLYISFFIVLIIFQFIVIKSFKALEKNDFPLLGITIYLDPGHGGIDSGTTYKDIYEKDINLSISKKIRTYLEKEGATVYLTRDGDYDISVPGSTNKKRSDLTKRSELINRSKCNLFISIHQNSDTSSTWRGPQVFYTHDYNKKIAELFQEEMNKKLKGDRKAKEVNSLFLLNKINVKGILLETGFLSNSQDRYLLRQEEYQNKIAFVVTNTVKKIFN